MSKISANLMLINKIIIFNKAMIEEDIDTYYFAEKFIFDLNFINKSLDDFWIEYLKFIDIYKKDDFIKTYSFTLKRFYKLLIRMINDSVILKNYNFDKNLINIYIKNVQEKIDLINEHNSRTKMINTKEQCINEEEYFLLLHDEENNKSDDK